MTTNKVILMHCSQRMNTFTSTTVTFHWIKHRTHVTAIPLSSAFHSWFPLSFNGPQVRVPLIAVTCCNINHYTIDKRNMNTFRIATNILISMNVLLHLSRALEFDLRYIKMYYIEFQYSYGINGVARCAEQSKATRSFNQNFRQQNADIENVRLLTFFNSLTASNNTLNTALPSLVIMLLLLLLSPSSSSPLCRVFIRIFLRQTMSLGNTVLQLFRCYYSWCLYR